MAAAAAVSEGGRAARPGVHVSSPLEQEAAEQARVAAATARLGEDAEGGGGEGGRALPGWEESMQEEEDEKVWECLPFTQLLPFCPPPSKAGD
jgi:hypothetical protein